MADFKTTAEDIEKIIKIGSEQPILFDHPEGDGSKILVIDHDKQHFRIFDQFALPPITMRKPVFNETESFIEYVNSFKKEEQTRIFVNTDELQAKCIIDYDTPDVIAHGEHSPRLQLGTSPEWQSWLAAARQTATCGFTQEQFAEFLEERSPYIVSPSAAEMIEFVTKMQVTRNVNYRRSINLADGRTQFTYTNDNESGATEFPSKLEIGIPVFVGGQPYKMTVLLRYRLQDAGALRFGIVIHRSEEILRDALLTDIAKIKEATQVPVHFGRL